VAIFWQVPGAALVGMLTAIGAIALPLPARAYADDAIADPEAIQCWWRTSASAVRIGEMFSVVLTCRLVETESLSVVVDHAKLNPVAAQLPPFDVLGGTRAPDLRAGDYRLFQYEYRLRIVSDSLFGTLVPLPDLPVTYRIQTRVAGGGSAQESERAYVLPPQSVRVISLVPRDASNIRDASPVTLADIEAASFRADTLITAGAVISLLGGLLGLIAFIHLAAASRGEAPAAERRLTDVAILRGVSRELSAVGREREAEGWTPELIGRALAASRIVAGYALARPANQFAIPRRTIGREGGLTISRGVLRRQRTFISASVTPQTIARELGVEPNDSPATARRLEYVQRALAAFGQGQYSAHDRVPDTTLDESLESARRLAGRLTFEYRWLMRTLAAAAGRIRQFRDRP
jgi:hypothetical protein